MRITIESTTVLFGSLASLAYLDHHKTGTESVRLFSYLFLIRIVKSIGLLFLLSFIAVLFLSISSCCIVVLSNVSLESILPMIKFVFAMILLSGMVVFFGFIPTLYLSGIVSRVIAMDFTLFNWTAVFIITLAAFLFLNFYYSLINVLRGNGIVFALTKSLRKSRLNILSSFGVVLLQFFLILIFFGSLVALMISIIFFDLKINFLEIFIKTNFLMDASMKGSLFFLVVYSYFITFLQQKSYLWYASK